MLETNALDRVGQLDVDAEIVGVQLESVLRRQPSIFADVHCQRGNSALECQLPMLVLSRVSFEADRTRSVRHAVELERSFETTLDHRRRDGYRAGIGLSPDATCKETSSAP